MKMAVALPFSGEVHSAAALVLIALPYSKTSMIALPFSGEAHAPSAKMATILFQERLVHALPSTKMAVALPFSGEARGAAAFVLVALPFSGEEVGTPSSMIALPFQGRHARPQ